MVEIRLSRPLAEFPIGLVLQGCINNARARVPNISCFASYGTDPSSGSSWEVKSPPIGRFSGPLTPLASMVADLPQAARDAEAARLPARAGHSRTNPLQDYGSGGTRSGYGTSWSRVVYTIASRLGAYTWLRPPSACPGSSPLARAPEKFTLLHIPNYNKH